MRFATTLRTLAGASALVAVSTACSFTYQSLYEGDARFEHCYRLDEERQVTVADKQRCWHDWSQKHTYGQSRDRIEYAFTRQRALGRPEGSVEAEKPRGLIFPNGVVWAPQPTNAFAPPPQFMSRDAGSDEGDRRATVASLVEHSTSPLTAAPGASCGGACGKTWMQCGESCKGEPCRSECDDRYRRCMRSCF